MSRDRKPTIFVASSVEGLGIAYAVQQNLRDDAEVTVWKQGVFHLTATALESLALVLANSDFGIFVFSPDDLVQIRGVESLSVRDNVVFELGLFVGRLGKERCFILCPDGGDFRIPTDLVGVTPATYETDRSDGSEQAACGPACHDIRLAVRKLGPLAKLQPTEGAPDSKSRDAKLDTGKLQPGDEDEAAGDWITALLDKDFAKAEKLAQAELARSTAGADKEENKAHLGTIEYAKDTVKGAEYFESLLREHPNSAKIYSWYAYNYFWNGIYDRALAIIERGIPASNDDADLIGIKARILAKLDRRDDAIATLEAAIQRPQKTTGLYSQLADLYGERKEPIKASNRLIQGIQSNPTDEHLLGRYAGMLHAKQDFVGAISVYQKLIALNANYAGYRVLLGNSYFALELYDLANECYIEGNKLAEEKQAWILGNIGNLLSVRGLYSDAIRRFKAALALEPESQYSHERLATAMSSRTAESERIAQLLNAAPPVFSLGDEAGDSAPAIQQNSPS